MILHEGGAVTLDKHEAQILRLVLEKYMSIWHAAWGIGSQQLYVEALSLLGQLGEPE